MVLRKFAENGRKLLGQSYHLVSDVVTKQPRSMGDVRTVLLTHAKQPHLNLVAISILKIDREVGLIQYWGVSGYLREKQLLGQDGVWSATDTFNRLLYGSKNEEENQEKNQGVGGAEAEENVQAPSNNNKKKTTAKVAFMITSTQRSELTERLGYKPAQIKKLTPMQASLALQHDVTPNVAEDGTTLQRLQQEQEEQEQLEQQKRQEQLEQQQQRIISYEQETTTTIEMEVTTTDETKQEPTLLLESSAAATTTSSVSDSGNEATLAQDTTRPLSEQTLDHADEESALHEDSSNSIFEKQAQENVWYEVLETDTADGQSVVVALYRTKEEAKLCLEIKEDFAARRAKEKGGEPTTSYAIRETVK